MTGLCLAPVTGWEALDGTYGLPDPDDEHVVAAAVVGNAGAIVTDNLKDFPAERIPSHITVITGSEFAENTADVNPEASVRVLIAISKRHKLAPQTPRQLLDLLVARYSMNGLEKSSRPLSTSPAPSRPETSLLVRLRRSERFEPSKR